MFLYGRGVRERSEFYRLKAGYFTLKFHPHMVHSVRFELTPHRLRAEYATVKRQLWMDRKELSFTCHPGPYGIRDDTTVYLYVSCHSPLLILRFWAWRSDFQNTRFQSFKCFHHCGGAVRLPFLTFAIGFPL